MFDFKSAGSMSFGSVAVQRGIPKFSESPPSARGNDWGAGARPFAESPSEPVVALPEVPDTNEAPEARTPELYPTAEADQDNREPPMALETEPPPSAETHQLELSIDSLPRHELIDPIPVTVDSLGDQVFTVTVHALDLTGTGNSLGDALITVKEQIEIIFVKLSSAKELDDDEKKHLTYLRSHIRSSRSDNSRESKRSIWR
jgi:hypothetical protein